MAITSVLLALFFSGLQAAVPPQTTIAPKIETVEVRNNRRIPGDTIKYNIQTKAGDTLNPDVIRRDIKTLYAQGYFDDIRVDEEPGKSGGVIVVFTVQEKRMVRSIDFVGINTISKSDILDKLKERKVGISQESPYDPSRIRRVEGVIKAMLAEKGHQDATVDTETEDVPPNSVKLTFKVNEGPAIKVEKITIQGNNVFSARELKRSMKLVKEISPLTIFTGKDTYYDLKLADDITRIRMYYADHGYVRANVLEPVVETNPKMVYRTLPLIKPPFPLGVPLPFWKKKVNRYYITLKVEENDQYKVGDVKVTGAKAFNEDFIKSVMGFVPGQVYNESLLRKGFENLKKIYGSRGYVNFSPIPIQDIDEQKKVVNLTINVDEDRQFTVNRIAFNGNTTTRDKVIRRQVLVNEGEVFNSSLWDLSLLRLNQLGYFEEIKNEDAEIKPSPSEPTLDINLKVKERGRNQIGFSGGVSGIGGSFLGLNYSTNNFLGLGETLAVVAQGGTRQSTYSLSFTEPYLIDKPILMGFSVYNSTYKYDQARQLFGYGANLPTGLGLQNLLNFQQAHSGFNISTSYPLRIFHRLGLSYVLDNSKTTGINQATQEYFSHVAAQNQNFIVGGVPNVFNARRLVPTYTFNTTNSAYYPTRGFSFTGSFDFTGGFLGGDVNYYRPSGEFRFFHPMNNGRNTLAIRAMGSFVQSFTNLSVPFYERIFAGGDFDIRGFDFRTISPISFITRALPILDPVTHQTVTRNFDDIVYVGGDTQFIFNLEYRIPLIGQVVSLVPFMDTGNAWVLKPQELERRIVTPGLIQDLPAQFLPGTNSGLRMSTGIEFQVVMPVLNAPFRVDFAFNPARIDQNFTGPVSGTPFSIHQPGRNFKFTVGRTF